MAKTLEKIVWSVIEQASNFEVNDDNEYDKRLIEDIVISIHPVLVRQHFNERRLTNQQMQMHLNVPVEPLDTSFDYNGVTFRPNGKLCIAKIPATINGISWNDVNYLGSTNFERNFTRKPVASFFGRNTVLHQLPYPNYCIIGDRVLFDRSINFFSMIGYFNDPREVNTYNENDPFPTVSEYKLELLSLQQLLSSKNIPFDIVDDGQRVIMAPRAARTGTNTQNRSNAESS